MGESVQGALPVSRKNEFPFEILFGALGVHNPTFSIQVRITETKLNANPNTTPNPTYPSDPTKRLPSDGVCTCWVLSFFRTPIELRCFLSGI